MMNKYYQNNKDTVIYEYYVLWMCDGLTSHIWKCLQIVAKNHNVILGKIQEQ